MPANSSAILIVDDDPDILQAGALLLRRHFDTVDVLADPTRVLEQLERTTYTAILLDMNFGPGASSGKEGVHWLQEILNFDPDAVVVLITAHGDMRLAVEAMKLGASDFVAKPWQNEKLVATVSASVMLRQSRETARTLKHTNQALVEESVTSKQPLLGKSAAMRDVLSLVERSAPTDANVLILGENGTGKGLVARALHRQSLRAKEVFLTVDLGAITESLFEAELFGYKKGAFTGATEDRIGRLLAANGGTLFLDEIGNLPLHLQAKLLTSLAQKQVVAVGSTRPVALDVRLVAATNVPRADLLREERFRQDLLFRLNTVEIEIPPLRDRSSDVPELARSFAASYAHKYGREPKEFTDSAITALQAHHWPGNIRALKHAMERAVILSTHDRFEPGDFSLESAPHQPRPDHVNDSAAATESFADGDNELNLAAIERKAIEAALRRHSYNISRTAKELGLTRAALYRRMEKYGF